MRELRFRAWYKDMMWGHESIEDAEWDLSSLWLNAGLIDYMQFTGFLDIHGIHIYEGDILQSKDNYQECNGKCSFKVMWLDTKGGWNFAPRLLTDYRMEIIGNIHENPDLL